MRKYVPSDVLEIIESTLDLLVKAEKAELIHDGSKAFGGFGRVNRSRAFYKKYVIYVGVGLLINVDTVDVKLFFDYRTDEGKKRKCHYEISEHGLRVLHGKVPEIITGNIENINNYNNTVLGSKANK